MRTNLFGLTPKTRDLIREIWRKPTLHEKCLGNGQMLAIIDAVRAANEPGAMGDLLHLAFSDDLKIRASARTALHSLMRLVPFDSIPLLDDLLRRNWGNLDYWYRLSPKDLASLAPDAPEDAVLLRLTASHRNGYVRAEAIKRLREDTSSEALPFILIRCADWVDDVRSFADFAVRDRLRPEHADALVSCLPLLERLLDGSRFSADLGIAIRGFLGLPECESALRRGMTSDATSIRRLSFRLAVENPSFAIRDVIDMATSDGDVLVRRWAFALALKTTPEDWGHLRERASLDCYWPIRRIAYESLEAEPELHVESIVGFLFDASASIRRECQGLLTKRFGQSCAGFYRAALHSGKLITRVSILGLAETGTADDASVIAPLLASRSASIRTAVIKALRSLGRDQDLMLVEVLNRDVPSVAREAAATILARREIQAVVVWQECLRNPNVRVWLGVMKVLGTANKWAQLQVYLDAFDKPFPLVTDFAVEKLQRWLDNFNRSFVQPTPSDKTTVQILFGRVQERLPSPLARNLDFVVQNMTV